MEMLALLKIKERKLGVHKSMKNPGIENLENVGYYPWTQLKIVHLQAKLIT